jgi:hypothetical protein
MSTDFVKQSLRENLARVLIPHVADGLWSIYDNALKACERNHQVDQTLRTFQNLLTRIPQWSEEILNQEVDRIIAASKCEYIEDLLLGVFVSYIRAFAALQQVENTHVDIPFDRPSVAVFIHALYKSAARASWSNAYLFKTIGTTSEAQARNRREIETLLDKCLNEVIDGFIPWRAISQAYFRARESQPEPVVAPTPAPAPAPVTRPDTPAPKPVTFGEDEIVEFETDNEEEEDEELAGRPRLTVGEDASLDIEDDDASVNTEDELEAKAKNAEVVSLNL